MDAFGFLGFGNSASWKEEVQLHDGGKIVVKRWQSHGGRHELGQPLPIKDHSVTFSLPGSGNAVTWKDEYSEDVGMANFLMLALHILKETPYSLWWRWQRPVTGGEGNDYLDGGDIVMAGKGRDWLDGDLNAGDDYHAQWRLAA